jgi:cellulose synthase/poly-beta-1,6-N-acetylglucosamine synthase-like glycosyltransferase
LSALYALTILYVLSALGLALIGFNVLVLSTIYWLHRHDHHPSPPDPPTWPRVVVQLPIYNERYVVERLIDAVAALDYPADRLSIQVLDDSTDDTTCIAAAHIEACQQRGLEIRLVQRAEREGFKAGALRAAFSTPEVRQAEFVSIFDADFVPRPDFLRCVIPYFTLDERLGMVQTRWSHINADHSLLTRAQALALDSHFAVEQFARHWGGLLINFNGTAGVWRRACIEDSGGWQCDTLSEDIDLSYRAQLGGWRCLYLPDVDAPAEVPPMIMAFKRQQARWATGTAQCLRKLGPAVLRSHLTAWQKVQAVLHLGGYFVHPLMLVLLLTGVPLMLAGRLNSLPLAPLGLAMFGPPVMAVLAQRRLYHDWAHRLVYFPLLMMVGAGIAVSNTWAVLRAFTCREADFRRTPKFDIQTRGDGWSGSRYALPIDVTTWIEAGLALYSGAATALAATRAPELAPFLGVYALGFTYVAGLGFWQAWRLRRDPRERSQLAASASPGA